MVNTKEVGPFQKFINDFTNELSMIKSRIDIQPKGTCDVYIGIKHDGKYYAVNGRTLYRLSALEGIKNTVAYFVSDQLIRDVSMGDIPSVTW